MNFSFAQTPSFDIMVGNDKISTGCVGVTISFKNTSSDTAQHFHWNIDGFRINSTSTIYAFLKSGTFTIKLTDEKSNLFTSKDLVINNLPTASFTASTSVICPGNSVTFTSTSTGPDKIQTFYWNFSEDNTISYNATADFTFNKPGNKNVYLFVKDINGCLSPTSPATQIKVNSSENVSFTTDNGLFYSCDETINFQNTSQNAGQYVWDFGDGYNYNGTNAPSHTYNKPGIYTVNLTKNDASNNSCTPKFIQKVYVGKPNLKINTIDSICSKTTFNINAYDIDNNFDINPTNITWKSLDGNFTADSTALSYLDNGIHTLTVVNKMGCPAPVSKTIKSLKTPNLIYTIIGGGNLCKITPVTFIAETDAESPLKWNLGDGNSQTVKSKDSLIHVYGKAGTYYAQVEVTNSIGCTAISPTQTITLSDNCKDLGIDSILNPIFKFSSSCDDKYLVTFELRGNKKPIQNIQIDDVTYPFLNGKATIRLPFKSKGAVYRTLVKFQDGTYDYAREISIMDETANFTTKNNDNPLLNCAQNNYSLSTDSSVDANNISIYNWKITDIKKDSIIMEYKGTNLNNISTFFPYASDYRIDLSIADRRTPACISDTSKVIKVSGPSGAFANLNDSIFCSPNATIAIKNYSTIEKGNFKYMIWDFGDGILQRYNTIPDTVMHNYNYTGDESVKWYNLNLKIMDNNGCSSNIGSMNAYKLYNPKLSAIPSEPIYCNSKYITINNRSNVADVATNGLKWQFRNDIQNLNSDTSFISPIQDVKFPSSYDVNLSVKYGNGISCNIDSTFKDMVKFDKPKAAISILDSGLLNVCPPYILHIQNQSSGYSSLEWTLSDSISNTTIKDTMLYYVERPSEYSIKLKLNGYDNCFDSLRYAFISKGPKATLTNINYKNCVPTATTLTLHSKDPIETYLWAFGDGTTLSGPDVTTISHTYTKSGIYKPSVTIIGTVESGHCFNNLNLDVPIVVDERVNLQYQKNYNYCLGDSTKGGLQLSVHTNADADYFWHTESNDDKTILSDNKQSSITVNPTKTTTYLINAKSHNSCPDESGSIVVTAHFSPIVTIPTHKINIAAGTEFTPNPIIQSAYPDLKYSWTPTTRVENPLIANPQIISDNNITYKLKVQNIYGCTGEDQLTITTLCSSSKILIPTGFTPNADGLNDIFYVKGYGIKLVNHFIVVDRWGKTVFERSNINANDIANGWDGKVNNKLADSGTYIYFANVTCNEGNIIPLKGTVVLIR